MNFLERIGHITRHGFVEIELYGVCHMRLDGLDVYKGPLDPLVPARSTFKPWQMLALDLSESTSHWAMGIASHSGEVLHENCLIHLQHQLGINDSELRCPASLPMHRERQVLMTLAAVPKAKVFHPCVGKHLLWAHQVRKDGQKGDYWDPSHLRHRHLIELVGRVVKKPVHWITDSCGMPCPVMHMSEHMTLWQAFGASHDDAMAKVTALWLSDPILIGGSQRLDTFIMQQGKGAFVAKEGADGLILLQSVPTLCGYNLSLLLKLAHGYESNHLGLGLLAVLSKYKKHLPHCEFLSGLRNSLQSWVVLSSEQTFHYE